MGVGMEHDHWAAFHFQSLIGATDSRVGWQSVSRISALSFNEQFFAVLLVKTSGVLAITAPVRSVTTPEIAPLIS